MNSLLVCTISDVLQEHVSFEADMAVPPSADLVRICTSPEFLAFSEQIKHDLQIVIVPNVKGVPSSLAGTNGTTPVDTPIECSFKFKCRRSNSDFLSTARELLEQFLLNHNVHVYPSANSHKRGDSFTEAFPHFDSKLLSTANHRPHPTSHGTCL